MVWLDMTAEALEAWLDRMWQLEADEAMHQRTVYAMGAGNVEEKDAQRILDAWRERAGAGLGTEVAATPEAKQMAVSGLITSIFGTLPPPPDDADQQRVAIDIKGLKA